MSRVRMIGFAPKHLYRPRRSRRMLRAGGLFLAVILAVVLAPYARHWAAQQAAAWSMSWQKDLSVTDEELEGLAADVLEGIVREGMTQMEQARAVFMWRKYEYGCDLWQEKHKEIQKGACAKRHP